MFEGLRNIIFGDSKSSKSLAKSRLHFVLVQDRTGLTAEEMASFRREMVQVIERYFVVDEKAFDISYERNSDMTTLVINSPVVVKRQESADLSAGVRGRAARNRVARKQAANAGAEVAQEQA